MRPRGADTISMKALETPQLGTIDDIPRHDFRDVNVHLSGRLRIYEDSLLA